MMLCKSTYHNRRRGHTETGDGETFARCMVHLDLCRSGVTEDFQAQASHSMMMVKMTAVTGRPVSGFCLWVVASMNDGCVLGWGAAVATFGYL